MYPDRDTLSNVPLSGYITARDQNMVESGVTEGGKTLPVFFFFFSSMNITTQTRKQRFLKLSQKFPEEKQKLVEEKDADNDAGSRGVSCE